jgi:hypothetical protein
MSDCIYMCMCAYENVYVYVYLNVPTRRHTPHRRTDVDVCVCVWFVGMPEIVPHGPVSFLSGVARGGRERGTY